MGKHTPGQWRVGDAGMTVFGPPNGTPTPEVIATVRKLDNARLVAAAPEMLEALKAAEAELRAIDRIINKVDSVECIESRRELLQIRAAIAKAEGRE